MRYALLLTVTTVIFLSSCVPNRKIVYLQKEDVNKKDIPRDTVLRRHEMKILEYRIQPLDNLSISFESITADEFDFLAKSTTQSRATSSTSGLNGILVDTQGEIEYPIVGKVKVAGLSIFEAQQKVQEVASQYINDVIVRIRLLNFRFTVLGEVNGEKSVISANTRLTMMEAVGLAGGLTELADRSLVKVIRQKGAESEVYYVNLLEEKFIESPHYYVQQNDIIIVPPLRQRTFKKYFQQNLALTISTITAVLFIISLSN